MRHRTGPFLRGTDLAPRAGAIRFAVFVLLLLLGATAAPPVSAQQPVPDPTGQVEGESPEDPRLLPERVELHPEAEEAISMLRSPWCPGLMLEVCPSREAAAFRDTLQMMAQQGIGSDSLVEWTLARYGEEWRAVPRREGAGLLAWVLPPLALIAGVVVVILVLRRMRGQSEALAGDRGRRQLSDDDRARLAEAMEELEKEGR